jgi:hypothetical protein
MTVFANMMEVSAKAQGCKIIAAFPDVCFTPPQTPATPPGVPIPYPNFGMDSDLASGSGTVKIGGKPISQENSSNYSKISGDEAGAAPKKGIITSKNMGKAYAQMWSMDVKADGKGVVRFGDIATTNHASNTGDAPPFPVVGKPNPALIRCVAILNELGLKLHAHEDSPCEHPEESEHVFENQMFQRSRGGKNYVGWGNYDVKGAPCICMQAYNKKGTGFRKGGSGAKRGSPHWNKTRDVRDFLKKKRSPTLSEAMDKTVEAVGKHHEKLQGVKPKKKEEALECLKLVLLEYLVSVAREPKPSHDDLKAKPIRRK